MIDPLTILHYALSFFPITGGMTTRIYNLIRDDGHRHVMVVPKSPSDYIPVDVPVTRDQDQYENIRVARCRLEPIHRGNIPVLDYLRVYRARHRNAESLVRRSAAEAADLVYGHGPIEFALAASRFAGEHGRPLIFEVHSIIQDNLWTGTGARGRYHALMNRWAVRLEEAILRQSQAVIVQTCAIGERIRTLYGVPREWIHVLYNGVDLERFQPGRHAEGARAFRDGLPLNGRRLVLYAGLLDEINGIRFFLDAYPRMPARLREQAVFCFAGRGECAAAVSELARRTENVIFVGMVDYERMPALMGAADLFLIPRPSSLPSETLMPVKLLEAMAMGKDVLVSAVGGMTEVVEAGVNGHTFPPGDATAFFTRLTEVLEGIGRGASLGPPARDTVARRFSWAESRARLAQIYRAACPEGHGSAGAP